MKHTAPLVVGLGVSIGCIDHTLAHLILKGIEHLRFATCHARCEFKELVSGVVDLLEQ